MSEPSVSYIRKYRDGALRERAELERSGVPSSVIVDLGDRLRVNAADYQSYLGIPKATYSKKVRNGEPFTGASGHAALGLLDLVEMVREILEVAGSRDAKGFDIEAWLGQWLQKPQPALGGMSPGELMDTPSGRAEVRKLLGASFSGAYV